MNSVTSWSHWSRKFLHAFRGLRRGSVGQSSFVVHYLVAALVVGCGIWLNVSPQEWCALVMCIGVVISAELFNSAIERLAKAITADYDERIRDALDIASAAVLIVAIAAAVVGATIFLYRVGFLFGWWSSYPA